jgi:hypothetical protein
MHSFLFRHRRGLRALYRIEAAPLPANVVPERGVLRPQPRR